jgi:hypothetical protein
MSVASDARSARAMLIAHSRHSRRHLMLKITVSSGFGFALLSAFGLFGGAKVMLSIRFNSSLPDASARLPTLATGRQALVSTYSTVQTPMVNQK